MKKKKKKDVFISKAGKHLAARRSLSQLVGFVFNLTPSEGYYYMQIDELEKNLCQGLIVTELLSNGALSVSFLEADDKRIPPVISIQTTTKVWTRKNNSREYPFIVTIDNAGEQSRILRIGDIKMMRRYARAFRMLIQKVKELTPY